MSDTDREEDGEVFDLERAKHVVGFVWRSLGRHQLLACFVFSCVVSITLGLLRIIPRSFHTEAKILAQQNLVMAALGNPKRAVPTDSDAPTKLAVDTLMKRDNLIAMIKQTNLLEEWSASRAPILRFKDWVLEKVVGPLSEEDKLESIVGVVKKRLVIKADEGTVSISIDWHDPNMAFRLVDSAQQNFLETRHAQEISTIAETISILQDHAQRAKESVDQIVDEMRSADAGAEKGERSREATQRRLRRPARDDDAEQLRVMITAKRKAIADLEQFRQHRLTELQTLLSEQRNTYGPAYPGIANTLQNIQALKGDSPQLEELRRADQELSNQLRQHTSSGAAPSLELETPKDVGAPAIEAPEAERQQEQPMRNSDEAATYARARLKLALGNYEDLLERLGAARIELDTARAAFKYRYSIIQPAQVSKTQDKPNVPVFIAVGIALAMVLAVCAALARDLGGGHFLEPWQIEAVLRVPLLATVKRP